MAITNHKDLAGNNIHTPITWEVADEAARLALTARATDIHKLAWQLDTEEALFLINNSPMTWKKFEGPVGSPGVDGVGIVAGGVTGQVLAKKTNTDYDTEWVNQPDITLLATISYVDTQDNGIKDDLNHNFNYKRFCRVASTEYVDLNSAPTSIDTVTLNLLDRVLVKNQNNLIENGIYIWHGAGQPMTRSEDANTKEGLTYCTVVVREGANHGGVTFYQSRFINTIGIDVVVWTLPSVGYHQQNLDTLNQNGALSGQAVVWNGSSWDAENVDWTKLQNVPTDISYLNIDGFVPDNNISPIVKRNASVGFEAIPTITDNGDGTVTVSAANVTFYIDSSRTDVQTHTVGPSTVTAIDDATSYLVADKNTFQYVVLSDGGLIDYLRYIPLAELYKRSGSNALHTQVNGLYGRQSNAKEHERVIHTAKYARESGLDGLVMDSSLHLTGNGGVVYAAYTEYDILPITNLSRRFFNSIASGAWTTSSAVNGTLNNTQYNPYTGLVGLTVGYYTTNWIFRGIENEDHFYTILSDNQYANLDLAKSAGLPAYIPPIIDTHAMLIGRVIIQNGATTAYIESAFNTIFNGSSPVTVHNSLSGLDGGGSGYFGHITAAQATVLNNTSGVNTGDQDISNLLVNNAVIIGATKTKITYDSKGLVTAGVDATTADIADSLNKRYVTDANLTVIGNTSGVNTGDQTSVTGNAGTATKLQTARSISGQSFDGTSNITIDHTGLSSIGTNTHAQIDTALTRLVNTSGTNTGDQTSVTGNAGTATKLQTARTISGASFDGSANVTVDHIGLTSVGTNTHTQIDTALTRLANTSGTNTGDQTTITGNAGTATVLQTARTISGQSFNGSANITIDHTGLSSIGTNTHAQIDTALTRLANTSGTNTGDQTISDATITMTDITTNNASTAKHGFLPKLPTPTGSFLRDDLTWQTIAGGGDMLKANNLSDVANVTTARNNILPSKTGNTLKVLRVNAAETDYELAAVSGGGTPASTVVSETTYGQSQAVGTSTNYAREDHTHGTVPATTITLSGDVSGSGTSAITASIASATVTGKALTGFVETSGVVTATDTILQAFQKLAFSNLYTKRQRLNTNFTTTIATNTNTNLSFSALANTSYIIEAHLTTQCSSTGGSKYQITAPTGSTVEGWIQSSTSAITTASFQRITAINTLNATALHTIATTPGNDRIYATVTTSSTAGTIAIGAASVTAAQTTTIFLGSFARFELAVSV